MCCYGEAVVLVFDIAVVAKALAQFEHSSEVLVFNLNASLEATVQFEQATEVDEEFLGRCLCLRIDCFVVGFGHAGAAHSHRTWLIPGRARQYLRLRGDVMILRTMPSRNL